MGFREAISFSCNESEIKENNWRRKQNEGKKSFPTSHELETDITNLNTQSQSGWDAGKDDQQTIARIM